MAVTYSQIQTTTLGSAQASVTLSSIPSTYTDLVLVADYGFSNALSFLYMQINGDTGSNYSMTEVYGTGSGAGSYRESNQTIPWVSVNVGGTNAIKTHTEINFMNYSNTTTFKTWLSRTGAADIASYPGTNADVGLWRNSAAINSITLKNRTGGVDYKFIGGSIFNL
jgi:hypothetical protein